MHTLSCSAGHREFRQLVTVAGMTYSYHIILSHNCGVYSKTHQTLLTSYILASVAWLQQARNYINIVNFPNHFPWLVPLRVNNVLVMVTNYIACLGDGNLNCFVYTSVGS